MQLNVAYACGEEYARHAGVSMISLFENNKSFEKIVVYLIDNGITEITKRILEKISEQYNRDVIFISCEKLCSKIKVNTERYPVSTYSKIFFGQFTEIDKIIYLDCDISITGSLKELWEKDISEYYVAGVWDDAAPRLKQAVGVHGNDPYINCGLVLMNLTNWRKYDLEKKSIEFIQKFNGDVPFLDQGVVNGICKNKILLLDPKYNVMSYMMMYRAKEIQLLCELDEMYSQEQIDEGIEKPIVIHWVTGCYNRPWSINCTHPLKTEYYKYLEISPWKGEYTNTKLPKNAKRIYILYKILPFSIFKWLRKKSDRRKRVLYYGK
ncbi:MULTISPECIES: glycosyltransferase family 8 protein [unclassified Paenibacillus]|uniref:glycosyltransferase family 8 protein n=1 Tax=unclassified Paenibacillus TaxID=185978 RepID=UPI0024055241|nr:MULTISPECIES: glycosyltransferase family 8 protein [unclassified Paenibacillus]MDF9844045.1 lipopolysaccharide biosynthesis glycosyltransferase [Paenibacillus sp. PastF-2]MDF9850650.1 lipopolysaccharide biosynthesis glycosyltransferase [Paenibacillus sp. PastM-2]MDF9857199.1 lipopolysaccharide biosynthesis glycosyltransferase [Paenibacillus sp. PastF-1]MDH6482500.1 lipopolysaccharide biosynthesis glycosyltransferase [Paenibacillus sp. PastH-2]MDH6509897.1 lipopolysaccharide biosynthesis gly